MKKFFGSLLVLIGTVALFFGLLGIIVNTPHNMYGDYDAYLILYRIIFIILLILGIFLLSKGKRLYLANGESPTVKKAIGVLMMVFGIGMLIVGGGFAFVAYENYGLSYYYPSAPYYTFAAEAFLTGLIYVIVGKIKANAGKSAVREIDNNIQSLGEQVADLGVTPGFPPAPTQMVCPECGKKYPLTQVYCDECGSLLKEN